RVETEALEVRPEVPAEIRQSYLDEAYQVSYAMQGKSAYQSASKWTGETYDDVRRKIAEVRGEKPSVKGKDDKPAVVQSFLGGKFLRVCLHHEVGSDAVAEGGEGVGAPQEYEGPPGGEGTEAGKKLDAGHTTAPT